MSLRRSARLTAAPSVLPLQPTLAQPKKPSRAQSSKPQRSKGITKAGKPASNTKTKTKTNKPSTATLQHNLTAHSLQNNIPPNPHAQEPTTSTNYWDTTSLQPPRTSTPPPLDRPVDPHRTNATLLTPHGSSLVAYPPGTPNLSPSKPSRPRPTATTGTLLENALAHLIATDPRLEPVIKQHHCHLFSPEGLAEAVDPFRSLVSSIIGQQVSGAAAKSIKSRFVDLFRHNSNSSNNNNNNSSGGDNENNNGPDETITDASASAREEEKGKQSAEADFFPTPEEIVRCDINVLRTAGLSQRKAEYIQGLSEKFATGKLSARMLMSAGDEELVEKLTAVRGLGKWSVEMFACFALKRTDVFSTGDLGVQRGCAAFLGRDVNKLKAKGGGKFKYMAEKEMLEVAEKFKPYRSLFMWYMWRVENVDVAVLGA